MIISGIAFLTLIIFFDVPGTSIFLILAFGILSLLYFFLGFALFNQIRFRDIFKKISYQNIKPLRILGAVGTGISLSITLNGILFKVMFWPGSYTNMIVGIFSLLIIVVFSLIKNSKNKSDYYAKILSRSILFGLIALTLSFISNERLAAIKYRNDPEYAKALIDVMENPDNEQYQIKLQEVKRKRFQN